MIIRGKAVALCALLCTPGTGNYHAGTSRAYTDYGLLSCDQGLARCAKIFFGKFTRTGQAGKAKGTTTRATFTLHSGILKLIETQRQKALRGQPALIQAKMNGLTEQKVIDLYKAHLSRSTNRSNRARHVLPATWR